MTTPVACPTFPSTFAATTEAVHAIAEHVLCVARHHATGRVGLRPTALGVETPPLGPDERTVGIEGDELVDRDRRGERRSPITTVRAAARFVGVEPGVPGRLWTPVTHPDLDAPLVVDPSAVDALASWFTFTAAALSGLAATGAPIEPLTLWPEGFDLATSGAGANFGGSPGDRFIAEPYLYVGPHRQPFPGAGAGAGAGYWNASFGAALRVGARTGLDDAVDFLVHGYRLVTAG